MQAAASSSLASSPAASASSAAAVQAPPVLDTVATTGQARPHPYKLLAQSPDQSAWDIYEQTLADFITSSLPEHGGLRRRALSSLQREGHRKRSGLRTGDDLEGRELPQTIWQTRARRKTGDDYDDGDYMGDSFAVLNPAWKRFVLDDDQLEAWVKDQLGDKPSGLYDSWAAVKAGIAKADFFRYLAMALEGGVYSGESLRPSVRLSVRGPRSN